MKYGFVKIAAAIPEVRVASPKFNVQQIESLIIQAEGHGVEIICMPELCLTAYTCGDLFAQQLLLDEAVIMPISHPVSFHIIDTNVVGGWYSNALDVHPFKYLYLKKPQITVQNLVYAR